MNHALTSSRRYNQQSHPLPFIKASQVVAPKKSSKEKPDLEEAIDESDDAEVLDDAADKLEDDEDIDLTKDKYVKAPKKKKSAASTTKGGGSKRKRGHDADEGGEDEDELKPKKGKSKAKK